MQYLLHPSNRPDVSSRSIALFLRSNHRRSVTQTETDEILGYITTNCIREMNEGGVIIDENVLGEGRYILEEMKGL
jgi:hypothetical protein